MAAYGLSDVPPQIFDSRTFVPLRLVSNALGVSVNWNSSLKTVSVDSQVPAPITSFFDLTIPSVQTGQTITGITELQADFNGKEPDGASEIRFLLLDPETGRGPVIARGNDVNGKYKWVPDFFYQGSRVLAAAVFDKGGQFLAGTIVPVEVSIQHMCSRMQRRERKKS